MTANELKFLASAIADFEFEFGEISQDENARIALSAKRPETHDLLST